MARKTLRQSGKLGKRKTSKLIDCGGSEDAWLALFCLHNLEPSISRNGVEKTTNKTNESKCKFDRPGLNKLSNNTKIRLGRTKKGFNQRKA